MRVHVVYAHPVETSFTHALYDIVCQTLTGRGHDVDGLDLYAEGFDAVLSRQERLDYHDVPGNLTPAIKPFVDRLRATEAIIFVAPVWNYGYPAILKGYFDRIFLPGVSFVLEGGNGDPDKGTLVPSLKNIKKVAYVTSYGGDRLRTMLMGDPPRLLAHRWAWAMFSTPLPPKYLAFYDVNNATSARLDAFKAKVRRSFESW